VVAAAGLGACFYGCCVFCVSVDEWLILQRIFAN
jgi:hypothetical protein